MAGWPTPEDAAMDSMPRAITHVVQTRLNAGGDEAYVLLAVESRPPGFYLDANLCERDPEGGWQPSASAGEGFSDLTLDELRASPRRPGSKPGAGSRVNKRGQTPFIHEPGPNRRSHRWVPGSA